MLFVIIVLLTGCTAIGRGFDIDQLKQIRKNETTKKEVKQILGKPVLYSITSEDQEILTYQYIRTKSTLIQFIPILNLFIGQAKVDYNEILEIYCGKSGKVESWKYTNTPYVIKTGIFNTIAPYNKQRKSGRRSKRNRYDNN